MKFKLLGIALMALGISNVYAATGGAYFGLQLGQSKLNNQATTVYTNNGPVASGNPSNTGVGARLFVGGQYNQYWGAEVGLTYYTPSKYSNAASTSCGTPSVHQTSLELLGVGILPIYTTGFSVFGKAGFAIAYQSKSGSLVDATNCNGSSDKHTTTIRPAYAFGVAYDATQNIVIDLSVMQINGGSSFSTATLTALGISYHAVDKYCGQFLC